MFDNYEKYPPVTPPPPPPQEEASLTDRQSKVEGMIQVFLQVLNMREAPPQIGIVHDADYAYREITGTKPINKNGALVTAGRGGVSTVPQGVVADKSTLGVVQGAQWASGE
jgi:hypothetical protein